jgi:hypothetical protein
VVKQKKKKYQSKLKKLVLENNQEIFEPCLKDCVKWFNILNREIFNKKLKIIEFDIRERKNNHAYYDYEERELYKRDSIFLMNNRYETKKLFVEILAHEMIHHYQYLYEGRVTHGQTFWSWQSIFNRNNLALKETY